MAPSIMQQQQHALRFGPSFSCLTFTVYCSFWFVNFRSFIFSQLLYSAPLDPVVGRTITRLGCSLPGNCYRGCRGGRRARARASVYKHCDVISSSYNEPQPIPTTVGSIISPGPCPAVTPSRSTSYNFMCTQRYHL